MKKVLLLTIILALFLCTSCTINDAKSFVDQSNSSDTNDSSSNIDSSNNTVEFNLS